LFMMPLAEKFQISDSKSQISNSKSVATLLEFEI
jgi:hypothetical protein